MDDLIPASEMPKLPGFEHTTEQMPGGYLYEPSESEVLQELLHRNFHVQAYRILLESSAAEQGARMGRRSPVSLCWAETRIDLPNCHY